MLSERGWGASPVLVTRQLRKRRVVEADVYIELGGLRPPVQLNSMRRHTAAVMKNQTGSPRRLPPTALRKAAQSERGTLGNTIVEGWVDCLGSWLFLAGAAPSGR